MGGGYKIESALFWPYKNRFLADYLHGLGLKNDCTISLKQNQVEIKGQIEIEESKLVNETIRIENQPLFDVLTEHLAESCGKVRSVRVDMRALVGAGGEGVVIRNGTNSVIKIVPMTGSEPEPSRTKRSNARTDRGQMDKNSLFKKRGPIITRV